jgi:hypothetical protein
VDEGRLLVVDQKLIEADRRVGRHDANAVDSVFDVVDGDIVDARGFWHGLETWFNEDSMYNEKGPPRLKSTLAGTIDSRPGGKLTVRH